MNMRKMIRSEKGFALIFSLLIILVLITFGAVFILRSINEYNAANRERLNTQAFYLAEGGAEMAISQLDTLINNYMLNTVNGTNPSTVIANTQTYIAGQDGLALLLQYVRNAGTAQFVLNGGGDEALHSVVSTVMGPGNYQYQIVVTEKTNPSSVGVDQWDFPYFYSLETTGTSGSSSKKVRLVGDFTVRVQRDNFARYALFTNHQTLPSGTFVWFTDKTSFAGPVHTNDRVNIAMNPSGVFDGKVTQVQQTARFYNNGANILLDADFNGIRDVPTFNDEFDRGVNQITLSSSVQQQHMIDQARGGTSPVGNGIFIPNNGVALTGGIYVNGNASISMAVDGSNKAVYTIAQGGVTKTLTVDKINNQTVVQEGATITTYNGMPDGMDEVGTIMYVNGEISSLSGTVQPDTQLTISSNNDILISNHVRYTNYTAAQGAPGQSGYVPPSAYDGAGQPHTNLLGLVTWNGNVRITTAAPQNVDVHGTILARNGIFSVDNYNIGAPRGTATLLGGVIQDYYGAFGLFNTSSGAQVSGYGRNFVYDTRMEVGTAPPYFPTLNTFIAFTNDIMDKVTLQEGGF